MGYGAPPPGPPQAAPAPPPSALATAGGSSTHPGAVAQSTTAGLPVSWPVPTSAQQSTRQTAATAETNAVARGKALGEMNQIGRNIDGAELAGIRAPLDGLLEAMCPSQDTQPTSVRKRQDIAKRLEELYGKLQAGQCADSTVQQVTQLAQAVGQQDFATAQRVHMELSKGDWNVHKNWLMGLKRLLPR